MTELVDIKKLAVVSKPTPGVQLIRECWRDYLSNKIPSKKV